jgi:hypothetical protein
MLLSSLLLAASVLAQEPALFDFAELEQLSKELPAEGPLRAKFDKLLNTPILYTPAAPSKPRLPQHQTLGETLRVAEWNVERGMNYDLVRRSLSSPDELLAEVNKLWVLPPETLDAIRADANILSQSDILILNELDLGMTRTDYRDVTADLSRDLGMYAAYGVEFVEVDPLYLGLEQLHAPVIADDERFLAEQKVDREKYKGLHGSAILSRFPLQNVRIFRFTPCYDWFAKEKDEISQLEKGKRLSAEHLFLERLHREVRQGGRIALIADVPFSQSPTGFITLVNAHLENKCLPACRQKQMKELLENISTVTHPLILSGDLNTTNSDGAPMSIRRELMKRVRNPHFWAKQGLAWFTPISLPRSFLLPTNYFKNYNDPTAKNIPLVAANPEAPLFSLARDFKFADGATFDFGGDKDRSIEGRGGNLSNSNERARKGFTTTFHFQRDFKGAIGRMRLDWFFVKPPYSESSQAEEAPHAFRPHFGRTLAELNRSVEGQISDHHPIVVDIPVERRAVASASGYLVAMRAVAVLTLAGFALAAQAPAPSVEVFPAELAISFGTASGNAVLYAGAVLFIDEAQPAGSFAVSAAQVKEMSVTNEELTVVLTNPVKDRSGERNRVSFRFTTPAHLQKVQEFLKTGAGSTPAASAVESAAEFAFDAAEKKLIGGDSKGRLIATPTQLAYEAVNKAAASRRWEYKEIKSFKRPNPYKVEIETFDDKKTTLDLLGTPMDNDKFRILVDRITSSRVKR